MELFVASCSVPNAKKVNVKNRMMILIIITIDNNDNNNNILYIYFNTDIIILFNFTKYVYNLQKYLKQELSTTLH